MQWPNIHSIIHRIALGARDSGTHEIEPLDETDNALHVNLTGLGNLSAPLVEPINGIYDITISSTDPALPSLVGYVNGLDKYDAVGMFFAVRATSLGHINNIIVEVSAETPFDATWAIAPIIIPQPVLLGPLDLVYYTHLLPPHSGNTDAPYSPHLYRSIKISATKPVGDPNALVAVILNGRKLIG